MQAMSNLGLLPGYLDCRDLEAGNPGTFMNWTKIQFRLIPNVIYDTTLWFRPIEQRTNAVVDRFSRLIKLTTCVSFL